MNDEQAYNLPHILSGELPMSESNQNAWEKAAALCARGFRFVLEYPQKKANEKKAIDEQILSLLPEGIPPSILSASDMRDLRQDYKTIKKETEKERQERERELARKTVLDAISFAKKQKAERMEKGARIERSGIKTKADACSL